MSAIELLNEPLGPNLNMDTVRQFYMDGWGNLRDSNVAVVFHDAFEGVTSWNNWGAGMWDLVLDTHHYEIFSNDQVGMSLDDHIRTACDFGNQMASNNKPTIAGEWTGGITDCAKWLNGKNKGARYDGTSTTLARLASARASRLAPLLGFRATTSTTLESSSRRSSTHTRRRLDGSSGRGRRRARPSGTCRRCLLRVSSRSPCRRESVSMPMEDYAAAET